MIVYSIYVDFCIELGKSYIGYTKHTPEIRWLDKCRKAFVDYSEYKLPTAIRKYGPDCWTYQVIYCTTSLEHVLTMESYFIGLYNTTSCGYNTSAGGKSPKSIRFNKQSKQRQSLALKQAYKDGRRIPVSHNEQVRHQIRISKSTGT